MDSRNVQMSGKVETRHWRLRKKKITKKVQVPLDCDCDGAQQEIWLRR